jgi:hypothetical protein
LGHFLSSPFPRTISTRTTEGRQVLVHNEDEALARFKQANFMDCRISAYSANDIKGDPNFIFVDIDSADKKAIKKIINLKFKAITGHPTVLYTGSGFHIYQPIDSVCLEEIEDFSSYQESSKQFLRFAERYLSNGKCDPDHYPSFKSCMVRIPGSINSKNGKKVTIVQEWDGQRPKIALLVGSFYSWICTKQKIEAANFINSNSIKITGNFTQSKIDWIELLLSTPLDDYRKTIVNLVLAPYLCNIRQLQFDTAFAIIKDWLELCAALRKLDFNARYLTNQALVNARKTNYKPMRLNTLKERNPAIYQRLGIKY